MSKCVEKSYVSRKSKKSHDSFGTQAFRRKSIRISHELSYFHKKSTYENFLHSMILEHL
jgi:hypothetical protein